MSDKSRRGVPGVKLFTLTAPKPGTFRIVLQCDAGSHYEDEGLSRSQFLTETVKMALIQEEETLGLGDRFFVQLAKHVDVLLPLLSVFGDD